MNGSEQEDLRKAGEKLACSVSEAVKFFGSTPETLSAEGQTAREALAHLVFWHREYVNILGDLLEGRPPELRTGKFRELNELAYAEFRDQPMSELADHFSNYQAQLEALLNRVPDPSLRMPVKQGSCAWTIIDLVERVATHVGNHHRRLKVAQRSFIKGP